MEDDYDVSYKIADDNTDDFVLHQYGGDHVDEIRMTKEVALQLAWEILDTYTLGDI